MVEGEKEIEIVKEGVSERLRERERMMKRVKVRKRV